MAHDHDHAHGHAHGGRQLAVSFALTLGFMVVEAAGGWLTNSLALLSDAGHMLTDAGALAFSFIALRLAERPPSFTHTFGLRRFEILAALVNGLTLWAIVGVIIREAGQRLAAPPAVAAKGMVAVAAIGLIVNLISIALLHAHKDESLNIRGAFLHVAADSLGSAGALAAGLIILATGWTWLDPAVSLGICLLILWSSWGLVRDAVHILLLGVPPHLDYQEVEQEILGHEGVCCLYDLHLWSITSREESLSAHVVVSDGFTGQKQLLREIITGLRDRFGIEHATLQIEESHEIKDMRNGICKIDSACRACRLPGGKRSPDGTVCRPGGET
ncbi:MAG: cation diffusion facilitator family transporter [Desulfobacteraceae bacterium]|nr:cation diffusion facilitator family transporter [Desulfobacteraceae bacterium]